ncbi:hypothetical protein SARC_04754 [Sphaeroforma arctica JP610]|uniref:C2 domain-containing protein n=1 Tax=Sphaeroforma arctica JP610 TaxID=667725 RepID=A0A0L0G2A7_9EUKA|nr:hypothetical protein SARC_04754 [Sphaeroforma arctica JP610]KNC82961.1 hypothetical protein SARC_04754 [Sphaeroforma arctica JP610]|eukprot:XP_014156863.1 hypothetical protein SARC_04754 [Sphaeroforma arctica JP610]
MVDNNLKSKVDLFFKGKGLRDLDILSKSDPQVWVYAGDKDKNSTSKYGRLIGKTETIRDNLNPVFTTAITIDYRFEQRQELTFVLVDVDKPGLGLDKQDIIGVSKTTLGDIVGSRGSTREFRLKSEGKRDIGGILVVSAAEVVEDRRVVEFEFSATGLDNKDGFFGKSDPFLRIYRKRDDGQFDAVYKSVHIMNNCNPNWPKFEISYQKLTIGDANRELRIDCLDWNKDGSEDYIGSCTTNVTALQRKPDIELINDKKRRKKRKYKSSGVLKCRQCNIRTDPSFLEYLRGGTELGLVIGVDFTASNGDPREPKSLHYYSETTPNEYVKAIHSVGQILSCYDHDQKFPSFGFGARVPPNREKSHCFPLNGNPNDPEVHGINGVLQCYKNTLLSVTLSGPTYFAPLIGQAAQYSKGGTQHAQKYTCLLILTDGVICDLQDTIDRIVESSAQPMSIVIVGVGNADFSAMDQLDADVTPLVDRRGKRMSRDTVQFVPLRDFRNIDDIAEATLKELPEQVVLYMRRKGIKPNAPLAYTPAATASAGASGTPLQHGTPVGAGYAPHSTQTPGQVQQPPLQPAQTPYPLCQVQQPPQQPAQPPYPPGQVQQPPQQPAQTPYPSDPLVGTAQGGGPAPGPAPYPAPYGQEQQAQPQPPYPQVHSQSQLPYPQPHTPQAQTTYPAPHSPQTQSPYPPSSSDALPYPAPQQHAGSGSASPSMGLPCPAPMVGTGSTGSFNAGQSYAPGSPMHMDSQAPQPTAPAPYPATTGTAPPYPQ